VACPQAWLQAQACPEAWVAQANLQGQRLAVQGVACLEVLVVAAHQEADLEALPHWVFLVAAS